jgi:hypothetical protein
MTKQLFNEAEMYLLKNWTDARLLERSLATMRENYAKVLDNVLSEVKKRHPELDCRGTDLEQDEDEDDDCDCVNLGVGRKTWPSMYRRSSPSGFWLCGITLGELVAHGEGFPTASIWIYPPEGSRLDLTSIGNALEEKVKQTLPQRAVSSIIEKKENWVSVEYSLPESRKTLLDLLLKDSSQGFIKCLVEHFETLTKFVPTIDEIVQPAKRSRK